MARRGPWLVAVVAVALSGSATSAGDVGAESVSIVLRHRDLATALDAAIRLQAIDATRVGSRRAMLPLNAGAALRLQTSLRLDVVAVDVSDVRGLVSGRALVYRDAQPGVDVVRIAGNDRVEELRVYRAPTASLRAEYSIANPPSTTLRARDGAIELVATNGRIAFKSPPPFALDIVGARLPTTTSLQGNRVVVTVDATGARFPVVLDPTWIALPEMSAPRALGRSIELIDGRVLVVGGTDGAAALSSAEIFDPKTSTWKAAAPMAARRENPAAVRLRTGEVLVACGLDDMSVLSSAEAYDPKDNRWIAVGNAHTGCLNATATLLPDDRVLLVGGASTRAASIYDPATAMFTATVNMITPRTGHAMVVLNAGKVLIAGGARLSSSASSAAEIFDPATEMWTAAAAMPTPRLFASGARLADGRAIVTGGVAADDSYLATTDVYDATTNAWTTAGRMANARALHALLTTSAGTILAIGGRDKTSAYNTVDLFDAKKLEWSAFDPLLESRSAPQASALATGEILVAGGASAAGTLSTAEVYGPALAGGTCAMTSDCKTGVCADSVCCDRACSGVCEACDLPGKRGTCSPITGAPRHGSCGAFACVAGACATSCTRDNECATGKQCASGTCVDKATCDGGACASNDAGPPAGSGETSGCSCDDAGARSGGGAAGVLLSALALAIGQLRSARVHFGVRSRVDARRTDARPPTTRAASRKA